MSVCGNLLVFGMITAIQLDGEPRFGAVEVEDVVTNEVLPPESPAAQTAVTEKEPQLGLRIGRSTPHFTRVPNEFWTVFSQNVTTLTPAPLPFRERGLFYAAAPPYSRSITSLNFSSTTRRRTLPRP